MAANDKETWKPVTHMKGHTTKKYAVSSKGRLASYDTKIEDKYVLKLHLNGGFPMATIHVDGKSKALFTHQAMGAAFLKKNNPKAKFVLHLDHNKANNELSNLKWATKKEQVEHSKKSPYVLQAAARKVYTGATARKLNEKKVIALKKEIWNPKRKTSLKQIAAKYGIAEMNLYRIKSGELWFHVHVEGEPIHAKYKQQLKNIEFHAKAATQLAAKKPVKKAIKKVAPKKATAKKVVKKVAKKTVKKVAAKKKR
ncbi:MAG: NUMOD4 domain-containing protein [Bacteroidota bacterium]